MMLIGFESTKKDIESDEVRITCHNNELGSFTMLRKEKAEPTKVGVAIVRPHTHYTHTRTHTL